jgi:uncharacterized protein YndB with AHSA1/START domain
MPASSDSLSTTFAALADPTRRAILARLASGPATVTELSAPFDISGPASTPGSSYAAVRHSGARATCERTPCAKSPSGRPRIAASGRRSSIGSTTIWNRSRPSEFYPPKRRSAMDERSTVSKPQEVISRVFRAPRALVFEVWTQAEHFSRWFGPHGVDVTSCELDARPGGLLRFTHSAPDRPSVHLKGTFSTVIPDERLELRIGFVDEQDRPAHPPPFAAGPDWPIDALMEMTVLFEDAEGGTRVTVWQRVTPESAASIPAVVKHQRMAAEGWVQTFARLGEHLTNVQER